MPHTQAQERYFRYAGIEYLSGHTESEIRSKLAQKYNVSTSKIQIDKRHGTKSTYIVTILKHKKPQFKVGNRIFILS